MDYSKYNDGDSIAYAIDWEHFDPGITGYLTKNGDKTLGISADVWFRVGSEVYSVISDIELTESDLDTGTFQATTQYFVYVCQDLSDSDLVDWAISTNSTNPSGWTTLNSRKIGSFFTNTNGNIREVTITDLAVERAKNAKWILKDSDFTANTDDRYMIDTSGAAVEVTFPAAPLFGDVVVVGDATGDFNSNNLTINPGLQKINGAAGTLVVSTSWFLKEFVWKSSVTGWRYEA